MSLLENWRHHARAAACAMLIATTTALSLPALAQTPLAQGEVRRIDLQSGKVTLRHGEIQSIDMPPMTMVFVAKPKSILNGLQIGDKIKFVAIEENSQYVVTKIEKSAN